MNIKENIKINKKSLVATIMLLLIIVTGVSFAFFTSKIFGTKESFKFGNGLNIEFILDGGDGLSYSFDPLKMTSHATENYLDSNNSSGVVSLTNNSEYDNVTCEYEVWFKADTTFGSDFSLLASKNNNKNIEVNLKDANNTQDIKITNTYITAGKNNTEDKTNVQNWTFSFRHYILKQDIQNDNIGKEYQGHIYFKAIRCFEGKGPGENLLDSCDKDGNIGSCFEGLRGGSPDNVGDGELLYHTPDDSTSAGDYGYRYSGNQPNNYICFGKGSEKYNRGEETECPLQNKYRIIGYVPVTLADDSSTSLLKVIKAEYLTEDEFDTKDGTADIDSRYESLKRIESSQSGIPAYKWNDTFKNNWSESTLYTSLNSDEPNEYKDKAFGENWKDKIENVRWNVGGISDSELTAQAMYEEEMTVQGATATVDAQIGLMYAHDYGFASEKNSWSSTLLYYGYTDNKNQENNWLFNGVYEWTISRDSSNYYSAYCVHNTGFVRSFNFVDLTNVAVRPVFYLKSDTSFVMDDESANGSKEKPFKIKPPKTTLETLVEVSNETSSTTTSICPDGIGGLIYHDGTIDVNDDQVSDDAGDYGYRYAGCNPNNYICFGKGSEGYNRGEADAVCDIKNKYRIIGVVPVTLADGSSTSLIKVIKAEYLTEDEFETKDGSYSFNSTYKSLKRVETTESSIAGYHWNDVQDNNWTTSSLYTSLNSEPYLSKAFGNSSEAAEGGVAWLDKIEKVKWNVGGVSSSSKTPKAMYEAETTDGGCYNSNCERYPIRQGAGTTVSAQIGLMYAHDYGFAASPINWNTSLGSYNTNDNRNNNWMFNGVYEWTISRNSWGTDNALTVYSSGFVNNGTVSSNTYGVRPVFYLKSDVKIVGGDGSDGSRTSPLRVK